MAESQSEKAQCGDRWNEMSCTLPVGHTGMHVDERVFGSVEPDVRPWRPEDGDTRCQSCGRHNPVWFVNDALWNEVIGNEGGILCPSCFAARAPEAVWRFEVVTPPGQTVGGDR